MSRANSTYEAAMLRVTRYGRRGLSLHAHYTYSHAMDWNPNESTQVAGSDVLDPANFRLEYGTSNLDMRHSAAAMVIYESAVEAARPGRDAWQRLDALGHRAVPQRTALHHAHRGLAGQGVRHRRRGHRRTGAGHERLRRRQPRLRRGQRRHIYNIGRNTYRYPATWKADLRLGKRFDLGQMRQLELLAESFNLFNHQNVTELETTGYYLESGRHQRAPCPR